MKSEIIADLIEQVESLPTRGAWIEIKTIEWREKDARSLPTRGAWIEILHRKCGLYHHRVAPHTGSVD